MRLGEFILYRIFSLILQVLGAVALVFFMIAVLPYDPIAEFLFSFRGTEEQRNQAEAELRRSLGLDLPVYQRYINFFKELFLHGSLGNSWSSGLPITELFADAMFFSFITFGIAFFIYSPLSLFFGILAAYKRDGKLDYALRSLTSLIYSIPPIVLGLWVIVVAANNGYDIAPLPNNARNDVGLLFRYLLIPIVITILVYSGLQFRLVRIHVLNVLNQNYIRTARSKGLTERTVIFKHALRNAIPNYITTIAVTFPIAFSGVAAIEIIFGIPGGGNLMVVAALAFDWPVLIAGTAIYTAINAFVLALTDIALHATSPRLRYSKFSYNKK